MPSLSSPSHGGQATGGRRQRHGGSSDSVSRCVPRRSGLSEVSTSGSRSADSRTTTCADDCTRASFRLLIAHGSFVHHHGHASFDANDIDWQVTQVENRVRFEAKWGADALRKPVLVTACLIVKNEEQMLGACLESVRDAVDEIVVYDTGSNDRTVQIAREAGATVVEGEWEDSFAAARNAALLHATGEWVLSIDADERLQTHPDVLRAQLADPPSDVEAYLVAIENLHGPGNPRSVHTAIRMFRRRSTTWRHRLHEQVVAADDPARPLRTAYLSGARLIHHGYIAEVFDNRNKADRNLELARAALDDREVDRSYALMNLGRALESAGQSEEAVVRLSEAADSAADKITRRLAVSNLVYILGPDGALRGGARPAAGAPAAVTEPGSGRHRRGKNTACHGGDGRRAGHAGPHSEPRARRRRHGVRAARGGRHPRRGPGIARPLWRGRGRRAPCHQIRRRARGRCRGTGALAAARRTLPGGDHGSPVRRGPRADARSGPPSAAPAGRRSVGRGVGQIPRPPRTPCRGGHCRAPTPPGPGAWSGPPDCGSAVSPPHARCWRSVSMPGSIPSCRVRAAAALHGSFHDASAIDIARAALDELDPTTRLASEEEIGRLAPTLLSAAGRMRPDRRCMPPRVLGGARPRGLLLQFPHRRPHGARPPGSRPARTRPGCSVQHRRPPEGD